MSEETPREQWLADFDKAFNSQETNNMPITISDNSEVSNFKKLPEGTHLGICDMIVDVGMQNVSFKGEEKLQHKVYIRFQVPAERVEIDGKDLPMVTGQMYTLSLNEKAKLRKHLEGWRGRAFTTDELAGFDLDSVLGVPVMISIVHNVAANGNVYANINSLASPPRGMDTPDVEGEVTLFELDNHTDDDILKLPKFLQEKIYNRVLPPAPVEKTPEPLVEFNDDIPF